MTRFKVLILLVFSTVFFTHTVLGNQVSNELSRTWDNAFVYVPKKEGLIRGWIKSVHEKIGEESEKYPLVVYLHGCSGINSISHNTAKFLADNGYAVVMPDSFQRLDKPKSCEPNTLRAGMHRGVTYWRRAEAKLAIRQARSLFWVDQENIFLWGFSEGAIAAATISNGPVNARIIEAWTCNSSWFENVGLFAPEDEPVLALLGNQDPWYREHYFRGHCGDFMKHENRSRSILYKEPNFLSKKHYLSWRNDVRKEILSFLSINMRN